MTSPRVWLSAPERVVPLFKTPVCSPGGPSVQFDHEQTPCTPETPAGPRPALPELENQGRWRRCPIWGRLGDDKVPGGVLGGS